MLLKVRSLNYLMFQVKDDKHKLTWRNCCDLSHAWTGLVTLTPGNYQPIRAQYLCHVTCSDQSELSIHSVDQS